MEVLDRFKALEGRFEIDIPTQHHFGGGVYAKEMTVPAGGLIGKHAHSFDHLSILSKGDVLVTTDEGSQAYSAPACISIKAGLNHQIYAITQAVWFCVHATDCIDPEKVDTILIGG